MILLSRLILEKKLLIESDSGIAVAFSRYLFLFFQTSSCIIILHVGTICIWVSMVHGILAYVSCAWSTERRSVACDVSRLSYTSRTCTFRWSSVSKRKLVLISDEFGPRTLLSRRCHLLASKDKSTWVIMRIWWRLFHYGGVKLRERLVEVGTAQKVICQGCPPAATLFVVSGNERLARLLWRDITVDLNAKLVEFI